MIPNKTGHKVISNVEGKKVEMGLDQKSTRFLMGLLTDAYNDPMMAILREYATNALDSHIEAGNTDPIKITLPTKDEPTLVISDQGVGLSEADIENVFSLYGASTKRETNTQAGVMGIGCKAGLTYADQFTVIATKDEVRTTVSVTRNEEGGGDMVIVKSEEVPYVPNGVDIVIPVDKADLNDRYDHPSFKTLAKRLFRFWPEGTVLVDNKAPEGLSGGVKITDDITAYHRFRDELKEDHIVQGNVPYETSIKSPSDVRLVVTVPNGSVDFTASREGLRDTERTRKVLKGAAKTFRTEAQSIVQRLIEAAPSKPEALKIALSHDWLVPFSGAEYTYKGEALPTSFSYQPQTYVRLLEEHTPGRKARKNSSRSYAKGASEEVYSVDARRVSKAIWVTGYSNTNWNALNRDRLEAFVSDKHNKGELSPDAKVAEAVITPIEHVPNASWIDPTRVFSWKEEVKKFKMSGPKASTPKRGPVSFPVWTAGYYNDQFPTEDINAEGPLFYDGSLSNTSYDVTYTGYRDEIEKAYPGAQIVYLARNRKAKFLRDYPNAKPVLGTLHKIAKDWWGGLSEQDRKAACGDASPGLDEDHFDTKDYSLILDPDLRESLLLSQRYEELSTRLLTFVPNENLKAYKDAEQEDIDFEERYPLLDGVYRPSAEYQEHALNYVNAAYVQHIQKARKS